VAQKMPKYSKIAIKNLDFGGRFKVFKATFRKISRFGNFLPILVDFLLCKIIFSKRSFLAKRIGGST
jgi:hypothetical protein